MADDSPIKTVDLLLEETGMSIAELAKRSGLDRKRTEVIVAGAWLPSPKERELIAKVFGVEVETVSWGHTMPPRNVRYHEFGMKENF